METKIALIFVLTSMGLLSGPALADPDARFSLSAGAFFTDRESRTRIDASDGAPGSDLDLEDDLGFEKASTVFRIDGAWRFAGKHRVDFSAFDLSRSATKQIEREIDWRDTTYAVDTVVAADLDLTIYKVAYTWMFNKKDGGFLGATAGLYIGDIATRLSATSTGQREVGNVTAPLPVVGLRGEYEISDRWSLRGSGEFFFVEFDDVNGSLIDVFIGVDYHLLGSTSVGLGFNSVRLDVDVDANSIDGSLDWRYDGAMAYLKFDF